MTSDEDLMARVRGGSSAAFETLFDRYREAIWRFFRRRTSDAARAEELAQDTFVAVLEGAARADEQRELSRQTRAWTVENAPPSLRPPRAGTSRRLLPAFWTRPRAAALTLGTAAVAVVFIATIVATPKRRATAPNAASQVATAKLEELVKLDGLASRPLSAGRMPGGGGGSAPVAAPRPMMAEQSATADRPRAQAVIRTATLRLVATDFRQVRSAVERIVEEAQGFADQMSVSADPGAPRVLRATLRVPGDRLPAVLTRLRALGQVTQDQQNAQDVTDQIVDLGARMNNARATEERLTGLLKNRTGKLSDILEVEQELSRVRLEIERLDAEKTNMTRRVAYSTIDLTISEERNAGLDPGPLPLWTQLRVAAADGAQNLVDTLVGLALFVLRAGPTVVLWASIAGIIWLFVKRARRSRPA